MRNKAFTLIELLAVIVILAIIALIAVPIVLNIINDTKKEAALMSVKNYIKAVELSVMNDGVNTNIKNLDGTYQISNEGKTIKSSDKTFNIEFDGLGLTEGVIVINQGKVTQLVSAKIDKWYVELKDNKINIIEKYKESKLVTGRDFNTKVKTLVNETTMSYSTKDTKITSIEFLSIGLLPEGYTLEALQDLPSVDISENKDKSIMAYNDNGKVYVYSNDLIAFNTNSTYMFYAMNTVTNITFSKVDTSKVNDMYEMFSGCSSLTCLDLGSFDTIEVTSMGRMFSGCSSLINIKFGEKFTASKTTSMYQMFIGCSKLIELDLSTFNTISLKSMQEMFWKCGSLTNIKFGEKFKTNKVTNMSSVFCDCSSLKSLDLSTFDTKNVNYMQYMFSNCSSLTSLDLSTFDTSQVTNMNYMFNKTTNLKQIFIGDKWGVGESTTTTNMFTGSKTTKMEELCEPNSAEEWCVLES